MAFAYQFSNPNGIYFVTCTTVQWVDAFTRSRYCDIVVESLNYCSAKKKLQVHAYVIMSNHIHLIISRKGEPTLSDIMKDFKKFIAAKIIESIEQDVESRRDWMLWIFGSAGRENPNNKNFQFWQQENHPIEIITALFAKEKINYLHNNPIRVGFVAKAEDCMYSSAGDYAGRKGIIPIRFLEGWNYNFVN